VRSVNSSSTFISCQQISLIQTMGRSDSRSFSFCHSLAFSVWTGSAAIPANSDASARRISRSRGVSRTSSATGIGV
jgi:hypothetical protein